MLAFGDLVLILATFDAFGPLFYRKASEHLKTALKSYYYISFDYLIPIHSHLGSCMTNKTVFGLILRFWRFGADFGYLAHLVSQSL